MLMIVKFDKFDLFLQFYVEHCASTQYDVCTFSFFLVTHYLFLIALKLYITGNDFGFH